MSPAAATLIASWMLVAAVALCIQVNDGGTREILEGILTESEEHVDWLEQQLNLISQVGLQNYLQSQMGEEEEEEA